MSVDDVIKAAKIIKLMESDRISGGLIKKYDINVVYGKVDGKISVNVTEESDTARSYFYYVDVTKAKIYDEDGNIMHH